MGILNYTTGIDAEKTAGEMQTTLAKHGANMVSVLYDAGHPAGLAFTIDTQFGARNFRLPANVEGVEAVIRQQQRSGQIRAEKRYQGRDHARRVAWRILKDWLAAQLAIIESGLADLDEVMLPYMLTDKGSTVTEQYRLNAEMRQAIESA